MTRDVKSLWGCIIILFVCVLVLGSVLLFGMDRRRGGGSDTKGQEQSSVLAVVGNEPILKAQWIEELQRQYGSMVLERMITTAAVQKEAQALGITISEDDIEAELRREMHGYESEEVYYTAMQGQLGMSPEQIRRDLHDHLQLEQVAIHGIAVSEEEIDEYYELHADEIDTPVSMQLSHLVVPDLKTADLALQQLEEGEPFEQVAAALSKDSYSSEQGGRLGWIDEDDPFLPANERLIATLMDIGTWSEPVKVPDGYAIVMLTGRKDVEIQDSEYTRELIRKDIALSKAEPLIEVERQLREKYQSRILAEDFIPSL